MCEESLRTAWGEMHGCQHQELYSDGFEPFSVPRSTFSHCQGRAKCAELIAGCITMGDGCIRRCKLWC